jgi:hypothetical protein
LSKVIAAKHVSIKGFELEKSNASFSFLLFCFFRIAAHVDAHWPNIRLLLLSDLSASWIYIHDSIVGWSTTAQRI